jgi:WS/DGAT/MGAT family acyltransferase
MWRAGQDPTRRLAVGTVVLLDRPPTEAALLERIAAVVDSTPRLQWRPDDATYSRIRPVWVEDDTADIGHHVRSVEVPAPGSLRTALDLISLLEALPFEPERSPWDLTVLHGLEDGGAILYVRAHHVLTDGVGGVRLLRDLLDRPDSSPSGETAPARRARRQAKPDSDEGASLRARRPATVTIDLTRAVGSVSAGVQAARDVQPLDAVVRGLQRALDLANSVSRQVLVTGGPLSPVPAAHSMLSHFDVVSIPGARRMATELGGSRNDVLVVAAASALGLYYEQRGQTCPSVRVAMPARQRRDGELGGNWFAPARVEVPTDAAHPARQFGIVRERLAQARHEPAMRVTAALASTISLLPNRLLLPALNTQADSIDLSVTTLPGLRGKPELCGATVRTAYPIGPRLGVPLNVTAFGSHRDLDIGVALDPAAITDPDGFRECLVEAFHRLVT